MKKLVLKRFIKYHNHFLELVRKTGYIYYKLHKFSCGELYIKLEKDISNQEIIILYTITPPIHESIFELLLLSQKCRTLGAKSIEVIIPYLYYSRHEKDGSFTGLLSALKAVGVDRIISVDIHSEIHTDKHNLLNIQTTELFAHHIRKIYPQEDCENLVIVSPDRGGIERMKRLVELLKTFSTEVLGIFLEKIRQPSNISFNIEDLKQKSLVNRKVVILDDIIDSGNTVLGTAELLVERGVKLVDVFVTHGVLSKNAVANLNKSKCIRSITITNTIYHKKLPKKFNIISVDELICDAIAKL